jgi:hypothetical protein
MGSGYYLPFKIWSDKCTLFHFSFFGSLPATSVRPQFHYCSTSNSQQIHSMFSIFLVFASISTVLGQCTPLLVNDYRTPRNNSIKGLSFDDNSLQEFRINNGVLEIVPKPNGYYFETGFCPAHREKWSGVEIQMTARENTEFFINFQTSNQCNTAIRNNYATSRQLNAQFHPERRTRIRFPFPKSVGNTGQDLIAISIENLAPFKQTVQIFSIQLVCDNVVETVDFADRKPTQPNSASTFRLPFLIALINFL